MFLHPTSRDISYAMDKNKENGLSIIELMVALLLSSLIILGVTQIYIDNKRSYLFQQAQVDNSDAARFSVVFLENELNKAGFRRRPDIDMEEVFKVDANRGFAQSGSVATAIANGIRYRYQASHPELEACKDADRTAIAATPTQAYVGFNADILVSEIKYDTGTLKCDDEVILENVADFKLFYAVGDRSDAGRTISEFTSTPTANDEIRGVRYEILFASPNANATDIKDNLVYRNWRKKHYNEDNATPSDGRIYQVASNTIIFRNVTP